MPSIRRCGHVRMRSKVHTALLPTNESNLARTSQPVNRSHNTAVNRDRWRPLRCVRGECRRACPPRRELQPPERAHHPEPLPRVRAAAQAQLRPPKRHRRQLDPEPVRRRTGGREGSRAVLQRPALAKRNRERAPTRAGRLQHPARRPARAHATSQGRGASVHPTEADGAGADHRGARQRHRGARRRAHERWSGSARSRSRWRCG